MSPLAPGTPRSTVTVTTYPMWRIRLTRELPRHLLQLIALAGLLASARFAIDPPRAVIVRPSTSAAGTQDLAAEGFAALFARRYLSWDSRDPEAQTLALAPFVGESMEADAGLQVPLTGAERVQWTQVVQAREPTARAHVYTVAVQTDTAGLLYLTVSVTRNADGELALAGYPALVGPPASAAAVIPRDLREVEDTTLRTVVTRALRNYLAREQAELAADLSASAHVSLPGLPLTLLSLRSLDWSATAHTVLAVVQAQDARGTHYTLAYELGVLSDAGRWEVSAIQTNP